MSGTLAQDPESAAGAMPTKPTPGCELGEYPTAPGSWHRPQPKTPGIWGIWAVSQLQAACGVSHTWLQVGSEATLWVIPIFNTHTLLGQG